MRREGASASVTGRNRLEDGKRVNRVIDHIHGHLGEPLSLASLARLAAFPPFHFHRVFTVSSRETAVSDRDQGRARCDTRGGSA